MENPERIAISLQKEYPFPKTELVHKNEMQLAIAIALSAQTTDKKVNEVTEKLFKKYKSWRDFAVADVEQLREDIRSVNFHRGKADRIIKMANTVLKDFGGRMPQTISELVSLPGFARKSANVMLNEAWNKAEGIVVDTHVTRVSTRLGLTKHRDAIKIENDLMEIIPREYWRNFSGSMVLHGRYVCKAKKPSCEKCVLKKLCPSFGAFENED